MPRRRNGPLAPPARAVAQVDAASVDSESMTVGGGASPEATGGAESRPSGQLPAYLAIAAASVLIAVGLLLTESEPDVPAFGDPTVPLSAKAVDAADALLSAPGVRVDSVDQQAAATLAGYFLTVGTGDDTTWGLDFADAGAVGPIAIERAMLGGYERNHAVERVSTLAIAGSGLIPILTGDRPEEERIAALAAVVELSGSVDGVLARVPTARSDAVVELARSLGLEPRVSSDGTTDQLVLDRLSDRVLVSSWPFACLDRVPLVGARGCDGPTGGVDRDEPGTVLALVDPPVASAASSGIDEWIAATTGPLDRNEPHWLSPSEGGVGWTNGEAQQYRDTAVTRTETGFTLTASPSPQVGVGRAPFDSGMVISQESFGWGRIEVDVRLPIGAGLWPAVWLLDAEACSAPGLCEGYETTQYHEIDVLETAGGTQVSTSVHWFEDRIRSISSTNDQPAVGDGGIHTFAIDRRPGLLVWTLDGVEIDRVVGEANATWGPHRAAPMRLIANLAVGGTFAGDRELGPTSPWWGSSMVPSTYPDVGWTSASLDLVDARFVPLDQLVFG